MRNPAIMRVCDNSKILRNTISLAAELKPRFVSVTEPYFTTALALIVVNQEAFGEILRNVIYVVYVAYHISVESLICPYVRTYVNAIEGE